MDEVYLVAGPASKELAEKTAKLLRGKTLEVQHKLFPDGENYFRVTGGEMSRHVIVIQSTYPPQDVHLMQLMLLSSKLAEDGAKVIAVVPYLAYARQHRSFLQGEVVSLKAVAGLMAAAGIRRMVTVDIHNVEGLGFFSMPAHSISAIPLLAEYVSKSLLSKPLVVGPDRGSSVRAEAMATRMDADYIVMEKSRDRTTGETTVAMPAGAGVSGRDVVVVDDLISTGGTIAKTAKLLRVNGAKKVIVACTHALLAEGAMERMKEAGVEDLVATDTIPGKHSKVTVAPLLAEFIRQL
jgi:ribose-phosphate pyrophosphokinase